jgi:hypothetical protein
VLASSPLGMVKWLIWPVGYPLSSRAIYHLTPLSVSPGTLKFINKIERAYIWAPKEVTSGAKCKVNWETVCPPKCYGGLGVLHLGKFAMALRLRWPWLEWKGSEKIWVGTGNPCNAKDMSWCPSYKKNHSMYTAQDDMWNPHCGWIRTI